MSGALARAWSIADLRRLARRRLPRAVFDFIDGGAENEVTLRDNCAAFERVRLLPKVLVDVANVDTSTTILGGPSKLPICVSPTGAVGFGRPGGDIAIARAAAAFGIPYTLSTTATASIERIAEEAPGRLWFQAYILKQQAFTLGLVERARAAGYEALVVTVDLPVGGKRERDFHNDFSIPFRFTPRNVLDFASRPAWAWSMRSGMPVMENLVGFDPERTSTAELASSVGRNYDSGVRLGRAQAAPRRLAAEAAGERRRARGRRRAHRGDRLRRADRVEPRRAPARRRGRRRSTPCPPIARAVGGRMSVLIDGGVRRGGDCLKAVALGAEAVLVGRATLFGACAGGEPGARRALAILQDELVRTMQLCGAPRVGAIGADLLAGP